MTFKSVLKYSFLVVLAISVGIASSIGINTFRSMALEKQERQNTSKNLAEANTFLNFGDGVPVVSIHRGRSFFVHYKAIRADMCNATYNTSISNTKTKASTVLRYTENWYPKGDLEINEMFDLPASLPLGDYRITKRAVMHCNDVTSYAVVFSVLAHVIDAPPIPPPPRPAQKPMASNSVKPSTGTVDKKEETSIWPWNWKIDTNRPIVSNENRGG